MKGAAVGASFAFEGEEAVRAEGQEVEIFPVRLESSFRELVVRDREFVCESHLRRESANCRPSAFPPTCHSKVWSTLKPAVRSIHFDRPQRPLEVVRVWAGPTSFSADNWRLIPSNCCVPR